MGLTLKQVNPAQLLPPKGQVASRDGQYLVEWSGSNCWWVRNFITLQKPQSRQVTPSDLGSFVIQQVVIDQARCTKRAVPAYLLATDGTNSAVWRTQNIALSAPAWTKGADVSGLFNMLCVTKTSGKIEIAGVPLGTWSHTFDFTTSDGGFAPVTPGSGYSGLRGVYVPGVGWQTTDATDPNNYVREIDIFLDFTATDITSVSMTFDAVYGTWTDGFDFAVLQIDYGPHIYVDSNHVHDGTNQTLTLTQDSPAAGSINYVMRIAASNVSFGDLSGSATIKSGTVTGTGINPFADTDGVVTRSSSTYGATFGAATTGGPGTNSTTPTLVAFDVQRAGNVSFLGGKNGLYKATTLGGNYSLFADFTGANVVAVLIPTHRFTGNGKQTTVSDPDVLVALDTPILGGDTLFAVDGATATAFPITPVTGMTFDNPHCLEMLTGQNFLVWGKVGGVYKLYESAGTLGLIFDFLQNLTSPTWITGRRGDTRYATAAGRAGKSGQVYLVSDGVPRYSSKWASAGLFPRTPPAPITGIDVLG